MRATTGRRRFSSRSFCVPITFARRALINQSILHGKRAVFDWATLSEAASRGRNSGASQEAQRVDRLAVDQNLVVKVSAGRSTRCTDVANDFAALHLLSGPHDDLREMAESRA